MDRTFKNGSGTRPYQSTCGMQYGSPMGRMSDPVDYKSGRSADLYRNNYESKESPACPMRSIAMGYVPRQYSFQTFEHSYALQEGTLFPDLCKPFCGKRGNHRC